MQHATGLAGQGKIRSSFILVVAAAAFWTASKHAIRITGGGKFEGTLQDIDRTLCGLLSGVLLLQLQSSFLLLLLLLLSGPLVLHKETEVIVSRTGPWAALS